MMENQILKDKTHPMFKKMRAIRVLSESLTDTPIESINLLSSCMMTQLANSLADDADEVELSETLKDMFDNMVRESLPLILKAWREEKKKK